MSKLTACFKVPLDPPLFANSKKAQRSILKTKFNDFDVVIQFEPNISLAPAQIGEEFRYCIAEISLRISRDLIEEIPNDDLKMIQYFSERSEAYTKAACVVVNRIIKYFKYRLHNPMLEEIPEIKNCFLLPKWFDANDNEIHPGHFRFSIEVPYGRDTPDFGVASLTIKDKKDLQDAIENEINVELYEDILSDAQSAVFQGNYRRAVLEMAMACELAIKRTYFSKSSPAGLALEFMEDSKNLSPRIKLTSYLTNIAEYALGEKFADYSSPADMVNIENLFHGRDRVVHRGDLSYKAENDKTSHEINVFVLKDWWNSVELLLAWLNSKRSAQ